MALKHLLIHLDRGPAAEARYALGAGLAAPHGAHLTGLYVRNAPESRAMPSIASAELTDQIRRMVANQSDRLREEEQAAREAFLAAARAASVTADHCVEDGMDSGVVSHLVRYARTADLVMVGKPDDSEAGPGRDMPHDVLFGAGVPVIVVPAAPPSRIGERVVIAWNGSREAARAVKDALPILERARTVTILCVDQRAHGSNAEPGRDLANHLSRHGIDASADNLVRGNGISIPDAIISRLSDLGTDLLVMGAWGHSRLREFVLGGVTKRILQHAPIPVLMSH